MAGLDDARMHGADGDLVQRRAFGRVEGVGIAVGGCGLAAPEGLAHAPAAVIQPAAGVGRGFGLEAVEIADGALQPQRGRVRGADRGEATLGAGQADDQQLGGCRLGDEGHVHGLAVAPQASKVASPAAMPSTAWRQTSASTTTRGQGRCAATRVPLSARAERKLIARPPTPCHPGRSAKRAEPGPRRTRATLGPGSSAGGKFRDDSGVRSAHHTTPTAGPRLGTRPPAAPAGRCRRRPPGPGAQTGARRRP